MAEREICSHNKWVRACKQCDPGRNVANLQYKDSTIPGPLTPENSPSFYGYAWEDWFALRDSGIAILKEVGSEGRLTYYSTFYPKVYRSVGLSPKAASGERSRLLKCINDDSGLDARYLLTCLLLTGKKPRKPMRGFFTAAAERGLFPESEVPKPEDEDRALTPAQKEFWEDQKRAVWDQLHSR